MNYFFRFCFNRETVGLHQVKGADSIKIDFIRTLTDIINLDKETLLKKLNLSLELFR